jgi:predicted phosphodiesterase
MSSPVAISHVKTRFLIILDRHNASPQQNSNNDYAVFRPPLAKADVPVHCGDLTIVGLTHVYEKTLQMLQGINAELKLVIGGNHDISLDDEYY